MNQTCSALLQYKASRTRPTCMAQVSIASWTKLELFSTSTKHQEQGQHVWYKCLLHHEPNLFCSSPVQSEPTWLHPGKLKIEAKGCINIARTAIKSLQLETLAYFLCFLANLHFRLGSHLTWRRQPGKMSLICNCLQIFYVCCWNHMGPTCFLSLRRGQDIPLGFPVTSFFTITSPLITRVTGAPQMTSKPISSMFLNSPQPWRNP